MRTARALWRMALVCCSLVLVSCATTPDGMPDEGCESSRPAAVRTTRLSGDRVRLAFTPAAPPHAWATLSPDEARAVLAVFHQAFRQAPPPRFQRALATTGAPAE
nr:hypothetical protein [Pyxidicoccus parkwaysis]